VHRALPGVGTTGTAPPDDIGPAFAGVVAAAGVVVAGVLFVALVVLAATMQVLLTRVKLDVVLHCVHVVLSAHAIQPVKHGEQDALLRKNPGSQAVQLFRFGH